MSGTSTPNTRHSSAGAGASGAKDVPATPETLAMREAVPATLTLTAQDTARTPTPPPAPAQLLKTQHLQCERKDSISLSHRSTQQQPVHLVRDKGRWRLARDTQLVNNLSWVVGFMELANAGDFAANVWNQIPVPVYAIVFMAIGGTVAGFLSIFAFRDARRACYNVRYLRRQRTVLLEEKRQREARYESTLETHVILAINFRELGTELVTRYVMDLFMGCGAVLICIGTFMAIGGANHAVWFASNLLSGYVGNAPIALFGLVNSCWALFVFTKAHGHVVASSKLLGVCTAAALVKRRARKVQVFAVINGTSTVLGGVGSMITATQWWGYVILIPVIISSVFCNLWWRRMMGYSRSEGHPIMVRDDLVHALESAAVAAETVNFREAGTASTWYLAIPDSLGDMLDFLSQHSLFQQYCLDLVAHPGLCEALGGGDLHDGAEMTIDPLQIFGLPQVWYAALMDIANKIIQNVRPDHFKHRERYLAELLGTYCTMVRHGDTSDAVDDTDYSMQHKTTAV